MEISVTAITRNRKFTKALRLHSRALETLEQVGACVNTFGLSFDILQLVFLDRSEGYARAVGCKGDRLFQVEVPAPCPETVDFASESAFVTYIAQRMKVAGSLCGLPKDAETKLNEAIDHFLAE